VSLFICALLLAGSGFAAPREHTILFAPWRSVEVWRDSGDKQPARVRDLAVDGKPREHTFGAAHEVTDRYFVVRRAYRLNDALPHETKKSVQWLWRLGGWISIDRQTGRVSQLNLPAFDDETSDAAWYRDYVAYCGSSDDGLKNYMVVSQLGRRKAILRKEYSGPPCAAPKWERAPSRVTFIAGEEKITFTVRAHSADLQPDPTEEENQQ
jgi:hypothetical protein